MHYLYILTLLALLISFFKRLDNTFKAFKIAVKKFINILPAFLSMLILVSIILFLIPDEIILKYLGYKNKTIGLFCLYLFCGRFFYSGLYSRQTHRDKFLQFFHRNA